MLEPTGLEWLQVQASRPIIQDARQQGTPTIATQRLVLRPLAEFDLQAIWDLRSDPEVMAWTPSGKPDDDIAKTREFLQRRLEASGVSNLTYAICLASTGALIGYGGCHSLEGQLGWPEIGYSLGRAHWGNGYATEFLRAFLDHWWSLPRSRVETRVDGDTVPECVGGAGSRGGSGSGSGNDGAVEKIVAITVEANKASLGVMAKGGMRLIKLWRVQDMRDESQTVDLHCYAAFKPDA